MARKHSNAPYPTEFKIEAVRLYRESGKSLRELADDLGVSTNSLREWIKHSDIEAGTREGLTQAERGTQEAPQGEQDSA